MTLYAKFFNINISRFPFFLLLYSLSTLIKMSFDYNTLESIEDYVTCLRGTYITGRSRENYARKFYMELLYSLVKDNEERFYIALTKELNKSRADTLASEISPVLEECVYFLKVRFMHCITTSVQKKTYSS